MSITTTTKKSRWAALALAALVVAGGTVAAPQAANAATSSTSCSKWNSTRECAVWVNVKGTVSFHFTTDKPSTHRFTVRTPSGKLLASGQLRNRQSTAIYLRAYTGRVKVAIQDKWGVKETLIVRH